MPIIRLIMTSWMHDVMAVHGNATVEAAAETRARSGKPDVRCRRATRIGSDLFEVLPLSGVRGRHDETISQRTPGHDGSSERAGEGADFGRRASSAADGWTPASRSGVLVSTPRPLRSDAQPERRRATRRRRQRWRQVERAAVSWTREDR